jgi:23S rRNA pseudouridine1911/1915/1917 synthase
VPSPGSLTIPADSTALRADQALARFCPEFSRTRWQRILARGAVWRDDDALTQTDTVYAGDTLLFEVPDAQPPTLQPVAIPLRIVLEEDEWLVVDKAPGMVVHPGSGTGPDTLVHALLHHCAGQLSGIGGVERPGIVHRLDKETSGLIVIAKSDRAHQALAAQFTNRTLTKVYLALVSGVPATAAGDWCGAIGRHPVHRHRMAVRPDGRQALSHWQMLAADPARNFSRFAVTIATGRTHQIRVHAAHAGHPLCGDPTYGYRPLAGQPPFPRVMLHAWSLTLAHPLTGKQVKLEAQPPADFAV